MHIKKFYPKDERFFKVLATAGNIRGTDANKIDISDTRLKNMMKDNLIKEVSYVNPKHKEVESCKSYCFTDKGKKFINQKYGIDRTQSPAAIKHNCKVAETIWSLQKREIDTIKPEWEVRDQIVAFSHIKDMLLKTNILDIDVVPTFKKYVLEKKDVLYLINCKEFLQFCTYPRACEFYSIIKNLSIKNNPRSREIPDYDSILKYDCLIRDFIDTGNIDLRIKYCPILIWWMISTIIPLRPSEFALLKRNCIYKAKDKYYIHIERVKSKADREKHAIPIMTEFQIPEALYKFINDFIDYANEIDNSPYLVSDDFYKGYLKKVKKRNKDKITLYKFSYLFQMFEKEVVEDIYHYEIVALGAVEKDNQIEKIRLGDTRHLAFMNMLMQGLNPLYIQRIGGHYTLEEQLSYCNHLDTFTSAKTYMLSKMLNNKNEVYYRNYSDNVDWGLKQTEKELLGAKFYQLPKVKDGAGRCTSTNFPTDCKCEECLFCEHFIPEKDVAQTYISELKQNNLQNIEIKKELLKKLLKEQFKDEKEIGTVSRNLASLINRKRQIFLRIS